MSVLWQLVRLLIQAILPALLRHARDTAEDGQGPGELEDRLRRKIREDGWNA
jgi:hypothetical protein